MKYFNLNEFDSPDAPGSGKNMNSDFILKLEIARQSAKIPFEITSGYRTIAHNNKVGGKSNSAHTRGRAVDIKATDSLQRLTILKALIAAGFNRFGIGSTFIHVDDDPTLPANVMWHYYNEK